MTEFLQSYGLFALEALTILLFASAFVILIALLIGGAIARSQRYEPERLEIVRANDRLQREQETLEAALVEPGARKGFEKKKRAERKKKQKQDRQSAGRTTGSDPQPDGRRRLYVLDFEGDLKATAVENLRREISAVLPHARSSDEIVVRLESMGGLVHSYGLAASQLDRIKARGVRLTVCVDRVAASGGYMMACVADRLLAAPFAVIGSIGVVAQLPNFHRLLDKHDVDYELFTAGRHKRTVTVFGKNTDEGRRKFQSDLEDTHALFQQFVTEHRPGVDVGEVATGEIWFGRRALERGLVDELTTSDEYLLQASEEADVLEVSYQRKQSIQDKIVSSLESAADRTVMRWWARATRPLP